jgi:hypothetical protein
MMHKQEGILETSEVEAKGLGKEAKHLKQSIRKARRLRRELRKNADTQAFKQLFIVYLCNVIL